MSLNVYSSAISMATVEASASELDHGSTMQPVRSATKEGPGAQTPGYFCCWLIRDVVECSPLLSLRQHVFYPSCDLQLSRLGCGVEL